MNGTLKSNTLNYYLCLLQRETKFAAKFLQGNIFSEMHDITELRIGLLLQSEGSIAQRYTEQERKKRYISFLGFFSSTQILSQLQQTRCLFLLILYLATVENKWAAAYFTSPNRMQCCPKRQITSTLLVGKSANHISMIHLSLFPLQCANLGTLVFNHKKINTFTLASYEK